MKPKKTRVVDYDTFVERAKEVHGDTYDYTDSMYIKGVEKIRIYCKSHGYFWQRKSAHIKGIGCAACSGRRKYDWDYFISKATEKHGKKYSYSEPSELHGSTTRITITCPQHGSFTQTLTSHVKYGCQQCGYVEAGMKKIKSKDDFIKTAQKLHRDKYDYSLVEYKERRTKVEIVCEDRGSFWQTPQGHLAGAGCSECYRDNRLSGHYSHFAPGFGKSGFYGDSSNTAFLYVLLINSEFVKIGLSNNIHNRVRKLRADISTSDIVLVANLQGSAPSLYDLEQRILRKSGLKRFRPSLEFSGRTECLCLSELPEVMKILKKFEEESTAP